MAEYEINTKSRIASFLAQAGYESAHFMRLDENLRYKTTGRLMKIWPKRFPTKAKAMPYIDNPQGLANFVYANRLGNGPTNSGDGYRFRGRGILQLTGRSNYADASAALNVDLIQRPELLVVAGCAARCAAWFWASRGLNALADDNSDDDDLEDFTEITRRVNGGTVGLQARLSLMLAVENHLA